MKPNVIDMLRNQAAGLRASLLESPQFFPSVIAAHADALESVIAELGSEAPPLRPQQPLPVDGRNFKGTVTELRDLLQRIRAFRIDPASPDVEGRRLLSALDCSLTLFLGARGMTALAPLPQEPQEPSSVVPLADPSVPERLVPIPPQQDWVAAIVTRWQASAEALTTIAPVEAQRLRLCAADLDFASRHVAPPAPHQESWPRGFNWRERVGNIIDHATRLGGEGVRKHVVDLLYEYDKLPVASPAPPAETPNLDGCLRCGTVMCVGVTMDLGPFCRTCWEAIKLLAVRVQRENDEADGLAEAASPAPPADLLRLGLSGVVNRLRGQASLSLAAAAYHEQGTRAWLDNMSDVEVRTRVADEIAKLLAEAASPLPLEPEPFSQTLKRDIEQALEYLKDYDASRRAHGYRAHQSVDKCRSVMEMALGRVAASPLPRPKELKHPTRTIIVATRLSEKTLRTTYLNAIDDDEPYIVTIDLNEPPHTPVSGVVPDVGETKVVVNR